MKDKATREGLVAEVRSLSLEVMRLRGENQAIKDSQESLRVFVMDKLGAEHGTGPFRRFKSTSTREGTFASSHFNFSPNDKGAHVTKPEILVESMRSPWTLQGLHKD